MSADNFLAIRNHDTLIGQFTVTHEFASDDRLSEITVNDPVFDTLEEARSYAFERHQHEHHEYGICEYVDDNRTVADFEPLQLNVVQWCANECDRQQTGPLAVPDMLRAWRYACRLPWNNFTHFDIQGIAGLVNGHNTQMPYRKVPAIFANGNEAAKAEHVERLMVQLMEQPKLPVSQPAEPGISVTPYDWVKEFLLIHPFADGNSRTASILHNLINSTLDAPQPLPDYFAE